MTTTYASAFYDFCGLIFGPYTVEEIVPLGCVQVAGSGSIKTGTAAVPCKV
jgi:hypothetical protein